MLRLFFQYRTKRCSGSHDQTVPVIPRTVLIICMFWGSAGFNESSRPLRLSILKSTRLRARGPLSQADGAPMSHQLFDLAALCSQSFDSSATTAAWCLAIRFLAFFCVRCLARFLVVVKRYRSKSFQSLKYQDEQSVCSGNQCDTMWGKHCETKILVYPLSKALKRTRAVHLSGLSLVRQIVHSSNHLLELQPQVGFGVVELISNLLD